MGSQTAITDAVTAALLLFFSRYTRLMTLQSPKANQAPVTLRLPEPESAYG